MAIFDDEVEPLAQFLESEIFALSDQDEMVEDILDEGDVKRKSKHFDAEEERVTKKMRVVEDEDEIERKEKEEQEEEEEEEKREAKVMKVEKEEEDEEERVKALLLSPSLSPPVEVEAEVDCASPPPRMSLNIMDNNNNSGASTSSDLRQVPSRIEAGILSKVPQELLHHILKFLSPEDLVTCSLVCKFLSFAASDESLWRWLYCMRWGLLLQTRKPRECAWKKLYIQRDAEDMIEFVRNTPKEFKDYYIQMQAAKRSQAPLPSQVTGVADQVSMWKKSKGLGDKVVIDHSCSGETRNYYQIGDVYVCEETGQVHVCDDTCREVVPDPTNGLLVCTISGHCFERMLSPSEMEQDGEQQQGGTTDEAEPFMGSGRFARAYLLGYNCDDEKELEAALRFC